MKQIKQFQYGSIVNFFCSKINPLTDLTGPLMGIAIVDGDGGDFVPCVIEKYWEDDEDAMTAHKIKLIPMIHGYATENVYVSDFKNSIGPHNIRVY